MTQLLDERRPSWVAARSGPAAAVDVVTVSLALTGQPWTLWFEVHVDGVTWTASKPLGDLEQFLTEIEDGLGSSLSIGSELAQAEQGSEDIVIPVGAVALVGTRADWRSVLEREKQDHRADYEPGLRSGGGIYDGERALYPVLESD